MIELKSLTLHSQLSLVLKLIWSNDKIDENQV